MRCLLVTHPEVVVDPRTPVPRWGLSELGRARAAAFARSGALSGVEAVISSVETKAVQTAQVLTDALGVSPRCDRALGENDRSATGYLPPDEFEQTADAFFAAPDRSARGWETAADAQRRVVDAVTRAVRADPGSSIAFVARGGVGTLLLCHLHGRAISRAHDQPRQGCWYAFDPQTWVADPGWRALPDP